ncbi:hypothetical protein [Devosia sp. XK-2]|uniref:hypothetical protein n=1 Tax=Devosia sp. XK-2 TaxID=3126689 RepID=UPI0030D34758
MKSLVDYPSILHPLFVAVGEAMDRPQLHPGILAYLPQTFSGFTPDQVITILHVSALTSGDKHGHYEISLTGTSGQLGWKLRPGELQSLAKEALSKDGTGN